MLAWPGTLNMLSIIVQGMGLQYINASVSQMISGAVMAYDPPPSITVTLCTEGSTDLHILVLDCS